MTDAAPASKKATRISLLAEHEFSLKDVPPRREIKLPDLPQGVIPKGLAMDSQAIAPLLQFANAGNVCSLGFPGYQYLAELAQKPEYRSAAETIAQEMTREWIELKGEGEGDHSDRIEKITKAMEDFGVREHFRRVAEQDSFFGRSQIYISIKGQSSDKARKTPLVVAPETIKKDSLEGFKTIEPMWTTPWSYNATDPTAPNFFKPEAWFVLGKQTHATRLLTFISREVPDMLKPSYNFGGMSMSQLMEPYVNQWYKARNAVANLIHNFSVLSLKTNMETVLQGGDATELLKRARMFVNTRDNRGLMLLDKDTEELDQIAVPLSGLAELQAQAQEHMAAPSHIPLVKLLGITPTGLNASSDGEIRVFYDFVHAMQQSFFADHLKTIIRILQLHLFGDIDEGITFEFVPLMQMTPKELSEIRKSDQEADAGYIASGVIDPSEARSRLSSDPSSGYQNLTGDAPGPPDMGLEEGPEKKVDGKDKAE